MGITGTVSAHQDEKLLAEEIATDGDVAVGDDLSVTDDASVGDDLAVGGDLTVAGTAAVTGNASVGGNLTITGGLGVGAQPVAHSIAIALAASATTDGMDITVTVKDADGKAISGIQTLILYMSESNSGAGITGDTYSGALTATTGAILVSWEGKNAYLVATGAGGVFAATLVDDANPADQYVVVIHPLSGRPVVSAVSGTKWQGAS